jgi:hypothetical protein
MKKIIALVLAALAVVAVFSFAACNKDAAGNNNETTTEAPAVSIADANEILTTVWNSYADDEKFAAIGGDMGAPVDNAPGKYNLADEGFATQLVFPADAMAQIDDAASIIHMMNANTFTAGAFRTVAGTDVAALVESIKATVEGNRWMCGFPEKLVIFTIDGYVVSAFGAADLIDNFSAKLAAAYPSAEAAVSQALNV